MLWVGLSTKKLAQKVSGKFMCCVLISKAWSQCMQVHFEIQLNLSLGFTDNDKHSVVSLPPYHWRLLDFSLIAPIPNPDHGTVSAAR